MEWLAVGVAIGAFGFAISLFKSRASPDGYGNVLMVMPLALSVPVVALMSSGLLLIAGFRRVAEQGLQAIAESASSAAHAQYLGHFSLLALSAALALMLIVLTIRPKRSSAHEVPEPAPESEAPEPKLSRRHATSVLGVTTLVCIAAVATLTRYEQRFVTAPLSIVTVFDADDLGEFSSNRRAVEEMRRVISNTLVAETFRALVVVVLFFVLFDAFLTGSRGIAFNRWTVLVSAVLLLLTASFSARGLYRQRELRQGVHDAIVMMQSKAETPDSEEATSDEVPETESETSPPPPL